MWQGSVHLAIVTAQQDEAKWAEFAGFRLITEPKWRTPAFHYLCRNLLGWASFSVIMRGS